MTQSAETMDNPLRAPWRCGDGITIKDCDDRIVAVVSRGTEATREKRCAVLAAAPRMFDLLQQLVDIEGPQPGTAAWSDEAINLLKGIPA